MIHIDRKDGRHEFVTEGRVLKAIYESGLHQYAPGVIRKSWKDGIDIDVPHSSLMNFVKKLVED